MSKMKFSNYQAKQSRIVEGVCVPISDAVGDYDELLREAVRFALRRDMFARRIIDLGLHEGSGGRRSMRRHLPLPLFPPRNGRKMNGPTRLGQSFCNVSCTWAALLLPHSLRL